MRVTFIHSLVQQMYVEHPGVLGSVPGTGVMSCKQKETVPLLPGAPSLEGETGSNHANAQASVCKFAAELGRERAGCCGKKGGSLRFGGHRRLL